MAETFTQHVVGNPFFHHHVPIISGVLGWFFSHLIAFCSISLLTLSSFSLSFFLLFPYVEQGWIAAHNPGCAEYHISLFSLPKRTLVTNFCSMIVPLTFLHNDPCMVILQVGKRGWEKLSNLFKVSLPGNKVLGCELKTPGLLLHWTSKYYEHSLRTTERHSSESVTCAILSDINMPVQLPLD